MQEDDNGAGLFTEQFYAISSEISMQRELRTAKGCTGLQQAYREGFSPQRGNMIANKGDPGGIERSWSV